MKRTFPALLGVILAAFPFSSQAETVAAYGVSEGEGPRSGLGMEQESAGRLSALNTNTGEHTNAKYFTTRAPGSFTAMARNTAGTLYAIQQPNRLVTVDETTGIATDVATLIDSAEMTSVKCPAMAFVPGSTEELYAIIKRDMYYGPEMIDDTLPFVETGFILVTIDVNTGQITETGILIGGQNGYNLGHGLVYDASLDRLIHGYYEQPVNNDPSDYATLEIIDTANSSVTIAQYQDLSTFPTDGEEVLEDLSAERPGGFQGMAGVGNGNLFAYSDNNNSGLFTISVTLEPYVDIDDVEGALAVVSMDSYSWTSYRVPFMSYFYSSVRAMDLTADGQDLLIDSGGELYTYTQMGLPTADPIITTSVGGFPLYVQSLATEPGSGRIFGLTGSGKRLMERPPVMKPPFVEPKGLVSKETGSGVGLVILDPNGPEMSELNGLDVEFLGNFPEENSLIEPKGGERPDGYNVYAISSIAFDEKGNLFGYDADYRQLVRINLSTGEVTPFADLDFGMNFSQSGPVKIEFNPEDGNFYVLTYGYFYEMEKNGGPPELTLISVSPSGNSTQIPLSGDFLDMSPNSFVFAGLGTFFCTTNNYYGPDEFILQIDVDGTVTVLSGDVLVDLAMALEEDQYFQTTGLALLGNLPTSDVSVGTSRSRLRGNNIYNRSGRGQSVKLSKRGKTLSADFYSKVENDGNYPGLFELRGSKGKGKNKISYFEGNRNVTAAMARGHVISLEAGKSTNFKVSLFRKGGGKWVSNNRISASYGSRTDLGAVKTSLIANKNKRRPIKPITLF